MRLILTIMIVGITFLAGCAIQQTDNITQNESFEQNEIQNKTIELPKEIIVEENVTELCKLIFGSVIISFDRDCIGMNITDSLTKQPIQNTTVKLAIYTPCLAHIVPCFPEIISEKQTNEWGFIVFYKDEIINHSAIKRGEKINTIIIDAKGYNITENRFDYEYNQLINFELKQNMNYCEKDSDCIKVIDGCCGCGGGGKATIINKNYIDYWHEKVIDECKNFGCLAVESTDITCYAHSTCINNTCIFDYKNFTVCDRGYSGDKDWCYYQFAIRGNNITLCKKIESKEENVTPSTPTCKKKLS